MAGPKLGRNIRADIEGDTLVLRVKLNQKGVRSKSGKSQVLAKTTNRIQWLGEFGRKYNKHAVMLYVFRSGNAKRKRKVKAALMTKANVMIDDKNMVTVKGLNIGQAIPGKDGGEWQLKPAEGMDLPAISGGSSKEEFQQLIEGLLKDAGIA